MNTSEHLEEKPRILVVDDNVDAAETLSMLLEAFGCDVAIEYESEKVLVRTGHERFDIFVLDIGLPYMDGYELVRRLKAQPKCNDAKFIALTGHGTEEDKNKAMEAGFHYHFVKPIDISTLVQTLSSLGYY